MKPELFQNTRVIVQGITGAHGAFHTKSMLEAGTTIVAGTSPNKAGTFVEGVPVYASIADIQQDIDVNTSVIFVPAPHAKAAIIEAIECNIRLIVCITEGIPVHDMMYIKQRLRHSNSTLIGPNCPGVLLPGITKLGIVPAVLGKPGTIGIVSRSGTLTYEVVAGLTHRGIGQKYVIGIGGDPIRGVNFLDCLTLFEQDNDVTSIVCIGEIGGSDEQTAAAFIKTSVSKPVYAYVAGHSAPKGIQLGHAGAILSNDTESATAKTDTLSAAGAIVSLSISKLITSVK